MKRLRFLLPVVVLAALVVLFVFGLGHDPRTIPSPLIGKPAPDYQLRVVGSQQPARRDDLLGRPLLVNFWASWCAGCRVEHPFLMQLAQQGVEIVGIDYKDTDADGLAWLERHGNPYRSLVADTEGKAGLDWGVYGVPETFVLGADGTILYKHIGPLDVDSWRQKVAPLLAQGGG